MGQHTSLHQVVSRENLKTLKKVLRKRSVNINEKVEDRTVLFNAVKENWKEIVDILLDNGADPNIICNIQRVEGYFFEWTAVHEACRQNNTEMLESLLAHGGEVSLQAHHQMTPLHVAAWHGHRESVQLLINAGCDVNKLDLFQESALVIPICNGDIEIVETLLNAGCKLNTRAWGNLRKIRGKYETGFRDTLTGMGPYCLLGLAIKYSWLNIACVLLRHGYNPKKYHLYDLTMDVKHSVGSLDKDFKELVLCLLAAGYKFKENEESHLDCLLSPPHRGFDVEMIDWMKSLNTLAALRQLCRCVIRETLRKSLQQRSILCSIKKLSLPVLLENFVGLQEFGQKQPLDVNKNTAEVEQLYFAVPRRRVSDSHIYVKFWRESCCWAK